MPVYVWIYNNRQGSEYISYNTYREITLEVNEYLLRDSYRDKYRFLTIFEKNSILNLWEGSEYVSEFWISLLNIPNFS